MRIVNVSDKPFEFTFNAVVYGPYPPGAVVDLPYAIAQHGIKRSVTYDEDGQVIGYKMDYLDSVKNDPTTMERVIKYECPLAATEQCNVGPFKTLDELRIHMEQAHWPTNEGESRYIA